LQHQMYAMVFKIVKAVWIFSLLVVSGYLLYVYAGLPVLVELSPELAVSRNFLFYGVLAILALLNVLQFVIQRLYAGQSVVPTWYTGALVFFHLFGVVALAFISLVNSLERFDYSLVGFAVNGSLLLLLFWMAGYPVLHFISRKNSAAGVE